MRRRERKHLKEDEFVSTLSKTINFFRRYQRELKIIAFSVLAVLVIVAVIRALQIQSNHRANKELALILELRDNLKSKALESSEIPAEVTQLEKAAGPGKFSRLAYLFLATYWVEKNDLSKAKSYLEKFPDQPKDIFYFEARDLLAQVLTWMADFDRAVSVLESLEKEKNTTYPPEAILIHLAEALEQKGDKAKALEKYRQVQEKFPTAAYLWNIADRIRRLGG